MVERNNEDPNENFDEDKFDPTEEAFFSDMINMEEEIASEAYELVEHALNLINSQYYDDGIEILRQSIGLYTQINKEEEIKAINDKISEVYLLKEKSFREVEIAPVEMIEEDVVETKEEEEEELKRADQLVKKAKELVERNEYEVALDIYDEAERIFNQLERTDEIEKLNSLIEECYNRKAEFLRTIKKETEITHEPEVSPSQDELKEEKLKQFLETKKHEEELSSHAYELLNQATELVKKHEFEKALKKYEESLNIFKKLNWTYEVQKIQDTMITVKKESVEYANYLEQQKIEAAQKIEIQAKQEEIIDQHVKEREEQEKTAKLERLKEMELQKMEEDFFKVQIDNMATEASNLAREYEIAIKKSIKEGKLVEKCVYPEVIEIYKRIKNLLMEKGWHSEAEIYNSTIEVYIQKFEQDKKVRQIEAEKVKKQKETEDHLKIKKEDLHISADEGQIKASVDEQHEDEFEVQNLRKNFDDMNQRAERLAREYEIALRQGKFVLKCPYPEIIKIYENAKNMALEKKLETEVTIFASQIIAYNEKLDKDIKLRQIEAEKIKKQRESKEALKIKKEDKHVGLDFEKLKEIESQKKIAQEEEDFHSLLDDMINKAEKLARDYDVAMKKAIKEGKLADNPPFTEIIKIYERARKMAVAKGREEDIAIYMSQIRAYTKKLANDKKLREVEAQKFQRQKEIEEMHKLGKKSKTDKERLKSLEEKREEEEEFGKDIVDLVDQAEKIVRDYELAQRKAFRKGEIFEKTPYQEVIENYKKIYNKVLSRGWNEQAKIYNNQIKIYQEKLEKHEKLLEVEAQKAQRQKDIDGMHKRGKTVEIDKGALKRIEEREDEKEFEKQISDLVDKAEKLNRNYDLERKKALKKGELKQETPYLEIIEVYKQIIQEVTARGWGDQAKMYNNQIKIYEEKLEKHEKLLEVEAQKAQRQKDIDGMHKRGKTVEIDKGALKRIEEKKDEKEFEKHISDIVDNAEKLNRNYDLERKKALKKGDLLEETPYLEIIEIYKQIIQQVTARGWGDQAKIYTNQIKIYKEKLEKHENLFEVEAQKAQRQKDIDEMLKEGKKDVKAIQIRELKPIYKEEDRLLDNAMNLIDEVEKAVKSYELSIKKDLLVYKSPYDLAITNYEKARELFLKIDWRDEAHRLINTIKFYKDKKEKDDKLREFEQKKLEEPEIRKIATVIEPDKSMLERQKKILEFEEKKKQVDETAAKIFNMIQDAERIVQGYELKLSSGIFDFEAPYGKVIKIYLEARKEFEKIGWNEEARKILDSIEFYKEKLEKDKKMRALEAEKVIQRQEELLVQQRLLEEARKEKKILIKEKKESRFLDKEIIAQFETQKDKAFRLMDRAKRELNQNNFDKAVDLYKESEIIFTELEWQEGMKMIKDSIAAIKSKQKAFEMQRKASVEEIAKKVKIEEKIEEQFAKAEEIRKLQQEEKRKEFLKIQGEKEKEREISEEAYDFLKQGTKLLERNKFDDAYENYVKARELFQSISWKREVSRINNELLFILKRERKKFEVLQEIKEKKAKDAKKMEILKEETKEEHRALEKRKKEEKRSLAREALDRKINQKLVKANKFIDNFSFNEGLYFLKEEYNRLVKVGNKENASKIMEQIDKIKSEAGIPIIALEDSIEKSEFVNFESAYKALDKANISVENNRLMKAISELNEARFNLKELKSGKKYMKEIDNKINELKVKLGKEPTKDTPESKEKIIEDEREELRARIAARGEERRRKVLDLLKKD